MTSNGALPGISSEDLRAVVRAVLRDVLPDALAGVPAGEHTEAVSLRTDGDMQAFVRRIAAMCEDAEVRARLRDGVRTFRLAGDATGSCEGSRVSRPPASLGAAPGVTRIERGAVTERAVVRAAADGARLVLGPRAVLTPLARDKARVLGIEIEKER